MKHVMTINRDSPQFDQYLDMAIKDALIKGAILNVTNFKQEAQRIKLTYKGGMLEAIHVFFGNRITPESVINALGNDIRIIRDEEREA